MLIKNLPKILYPSVSFERPVRQLRQMGTHGVYSICKGSFHSWFIVPVEEVFVLPWLL